jgi:hypothetical protein
MVVTELAVTGLRCIEHAEGDAGSGKTTLSEAVLSGRGILSFIGDSSGLRQPEQDHLRVIVRRCPFWVSRPWASRSAGTHHGACLPGTACGARLRGSHHLIPMWGSGISCLSRVTAWSKTIPIDEPV